MTESMPTFASVIADCRRLVRARELGEFYDMFLKALATQLGCCDGVLYAVNDTYDRLVPVHSFGGGHKDPPSFSLDPNDGDPLLVRALYSEAIIDELENTGTQRLHHYHQLLCRTAGRVMIVPAYHKGSGRARFLSFVCGQKHGLTVDQKNVALGFSAFAAELSGMVADLTHYSRGARDLERSIGQLRHRFENMEKNVPALIGTRMVGESSQMLRLRKQLTNYASSALSVLILGETGTGKEVAARSLHVLSSRSEGPFVAENVAALPEHLVESELFGHVRGAFTGADANKTGLVTQANGGTLFLDEIGDMPLATQAKLLRTIQERAVRPLGSDKRIEVDFRLITATHHPVEQLVGKGRFREDLFYRIAQLIVRVPPLRERTSDIGLLADHFLEDIAAREGTPAKRLDGGALEALMEHSYPGNVREFRTLIERLALVCAGRATIEREDVQRVLKDAARLKPLSKGMAQIGGVAGEMKGLRDALWDYESQLLGEAFRQCGGNRARMAELLNIPKRTLADKIVRFKINA